MNMATNEYTDSFTIGTPAKGGSFKVYFDTDDLKGSTKKIAKLLVLHKIFSEGNEKLTPEALKEMVEQNDR